jgi:hypothetical protein
MSDATSLQTSQHHLTTHIPTLATVKIITSFIATINHDLHSDIHKT